ncbi:MAG: thiamine phosphate synthase [SAR324 cluster bacterium]|nr:thiamine phosphate synthase [SAR324 cluster bacterium]
MNLIVITTPEPYAGEVALIQTMMQNGLERLHLRRPNWSKTDCANFLDQFEPVEQKKIYLHQFQELAADYSLGGVHFKEIDCNDHLCARVKALKAASTGLKVSMALHSLAQIEKKWPCIDFALVSPVFDSISKRSVKANFDLTDLKESLQKKSVDIFALGGICESNITKAKALNFNGVATLGGVWESDDPALAFERLDQEVKKAWNN